MFPTIKNEIREWQASRQKHFLRQRRKKQSRSEKVDLQSIRKRESGKSDKEKINEMNLMHRHFIHAKSYIA